MPEDAPEKSFLSCLHQLLSIYGEDRNLDILLNNADFRHNEAITSEHIENWGEKIGVKLVMKPTDFIELSQIDAPCIIIRNDDYSQFFVPDSDDLSIKEEEYSGYIILFNGALSNDNLVIDDNQNSKKHPIDWFWTPILSYWKSYAEIIICSILINLFAMSLPLYTMNIYDKVVPNFAQDTLVALTIGIIIVLILDFIIKTIRSYILEYISTDVSTKFDVLLMERFFAFPTLALDMSVGERSSIFRELQTIRDFYASKLAVVFVDLPFFILFILVIHALSPALSMIPLAGGVTILLINLFLYIPINRYSKKHLQDVQSKSSALIEMLSGMNTIKIFNSVSSHISRWSVISKNTAQSAQRSQFLTESTQHFSMMILFMVNISVVYFGVYEIEAGNLSVGALIACTILSSRAVSPILGVSGILSRLKHAQGILKAINDLFDLPYEGENPEKYEQKNDFNGKIEFKNVSFQYPNHPQPALNNVSFSINTGEKIGIIGQTGAGKTTIAQLISDNIQAQDGSVLVDEHDITTIHPVSWRNNIGIVPQTPHFFSGSIRENILLGRVDISEDAFKQACTISGLDLFIAQTGQGFDSQVGERGEWLSGGQRQSIALARALAHNPDIIIFDEPTNGMDHALELHIINNLQDYLRDKTFIMITHRTPLLPLVNRLLLINKGQVAADGERDLIMNKLSGV